MNYYNEWDRPTAAWLQELINQRLIPDGHVDTRSICDVQPGDLDGYTQCHFFAGIGGWSYALQLAGWGADRPVWTGSCPCQPFSAAGKQKGTADERHLWPELKRLIKACNPETIFGEQVAPPEVVGTQLEASFVIAVQSGDYARANKLAKQLVRASGFHYFKRWIDGIQADLGTEGYTVWPSVLGAHSVRAPHIRQRLYWVADAQRRPAERHGYELAGTACRVQGEARERQRLRDDAGHGGTDSRLGDADGAGPQQRQQAPEAARYRSAAESAGSGLGDADSPAQERFRLVSLPMEPQQEAGRPGYATPWQGATSIPCADGKSRRVEPSIQLLAHGVPARVVRLRGYGNAIVPACAQAFIEAYMEIKG